MDPASLLADSDPARPGEQGQELSKHPFFSNNHLGEVLANSIEQVDKINIMPTF